MNRLHHIFWCVYLQRYFIWRSDHKHGDRGFQWERHYGMVFTSKIISKRTFTLSLLCITVYAIFKTIFNPCHSSRFDSNIHHITVVKCSCPSEPLGHSWWQFRGGWDTHRFRRRWKRASVGWCGAAVCSLYEVVHSGHIQHRHSVCYPITFSPSCLSICI